MQDCIGEYLWLDIGTAIIRVQVEDLLMASAVPILNQLGTSLNSHPFYSRLQ